MVLNFLLSFPCISWKELRLDPLLRWKGACSDTLLRYFWPEACPHFTTHSQSSLIAHAAFSQLFCRAWLWTPNHGKLIGRPYEIILRTIWTQLDYLSIKLIELCIRISLVVWKGKKWQKFSWLMVFNYNCIVVSWNNCYSLCW